MLRNDPGSEAHRFEIEYLDVQFIDTQIYSKKKYRAIYKPALPFSEPVKVWDFRQKVIMVYLGV